MSFIGTDGSSHTLGRSIGPIGSRVVLLSSRLEDERFTVDVEENISLVVNSGRRWPGFLVRTVVDDEEKRLNVFRCCASESCSTAQFR